MGSLRVVSPRVSSSPTGNASSELEGSPDALSDAYALSLGEAPYPLLDEESAASGSGISGGILPGRGGDSV